MDTLPGGLDTGFIDKRQRYILASLIENTLKKAYALRCQTLFLLFVRARRPKTSVSAASVDVVLEYTAETERPMELESEPR